jgi:hypothetical protein
MKLKRLSIYCVFGLCLLGILTPVAISVMAQPEEEIPAEYPEPDAGNLRAFVELVRSDVQTQKAYILAQNMEFTEDESVEFWPLHREYEFDLSKLYYRRLAIIKKFLSSYDDMTDAQARHLADEALSLEESRTKLKRQYFKKFSKIITPKKALRFFQIENQINTAIDLRIAATLPLIK